MLAEHQLSYADVGVGELDEFAVTTLFATAQSRQLTFGRENTTADIVNKAGKSLHLGNYATRLTVPPSRLLRGSRTWDRVLIGTKASSYGNMLFETECVLARPGELEGQADPCATDRFPKLQAGAGFWIEEEGREPEMSLPRAELLAELPSLSAPPESMKRFRDARSEGARSLRFEPNVARGVAVRYRVMPGRDCAVGKAVTCSQFVRILDAAQRELLGDESRVPFPTAVTDALCVLDSETYLLGRCYGGQTLRIDFWMRFSPWDAALGKASDDIIPAAVLETAAEVSTLPDNNLVAVSKTSKIVALPVAAQRAAKDTERLLRHVEKV